jgi:hypothetical protein
LCSQAICLAVVEDSGFIGEARQIDVVREQFFGLAAVSVVERVEEVETDGSGDQFELRQPLRSFRGLLDIHSLAAFII